MSDTDSFIEEVTEEVRRDRLYLLMRRYGWIAVAAVLLIVAGTGWNEWRKAQDRAMAQSTGDSIIAALEQETPGEQANALAAIDSVDPEVAAMVDMLAAGVQADTAPSEAAVLLLQVADNNDVELIYRQIATLKAVSIPGSGLSIEDRRARLDALTLVGGLIRLLAEEQLAYLTVETGDIDAAIEMLQQIAADAEASAGLRQRTTQVIVALGGEPIPEPQQEQ